MSSEIEYLNTDLHLESDEDLTSLCVALEAADALILYAGRDDDGRWTARLEAGGEMHYRHPGTDYSPNGHITWLLDTVDSLPEEPRQKWHRCTRKEFDSGYDFGFRPFGFGQAIAPEVLARVVAHGATVSITLYPPAAMRQPPPGPSWRRYPRRTTRAASVP